MKRGEDGRYEHDGNMHRLCVCGHTLGDHAAGSPPDCLVYSFSESDRANMVNGNNPDCGCLKFKLQRKRAE